MTVRAVATEKKRVSEANLTSSTLSSSTLELSVYHLSARRHCYHTCLAMASHLVKQFTIHSARGSILQLIRPYAKPRNARLPVSVGTPQGSTYRTFVTSRVHCAARPKDNEIPFDTVQLVSSEDNTLSPPQRMADILARYSAKTHTIHLVSSSPPIVRVFAKSDLQKADRSAKEKAKSRRKTKQETSELQVTWESATGDLQHKLNQAKHILSEGDRLDLVFTSRAKNASAAPQYDGRKLKRAQETILNMFTTELGEIAFKRKEDAISTNGTMVTMYYEPNKDLRQQALDKAEEAADQKAREKQAKKEERRIKEEERRKKAQIEEEERRRKLGQL